MLTDLSGRYTVIDLDNQLIVERDCQLEKGKVGENNKKPATENQSELHDSSWVEKNINDVIGSRTREKESRVALALYD